MSDAQPVLPLGESRRLTEGELAIAQKLFGNSINYDDIRIQNGKESMLWKASSYIGDKCGANNTCCRAQTVCSTIYMPKEQYLDDYSKGSSTERSLFVHEMTHTWQFQNCQLPAALKTVEDVINLRSYDGVYNFTIDPRKDLGDYNVEQQAGIMEEYYAWQEGRSGQPAAPPVKFTPEELDKGFFYSSRLAKITERHRKDPNDPDVAGWIKEGFVRFDEAGAAHYTQAYADKLFQDSIDYSAKREKSDQDLLKVMDNFRKDPAYLDYSTEAKAGAVVLGGAVLLGVVTPVVVVGSAAVLTYKAAMIASDTCSIYAQNDAQVDVMTAPRKHKSTDTPALSNYTQSLMSNIRFSHHMRADQMKGVVEKNRDGRIANMKDIDFSIPENRAEFVRMLDIEIRNQKKIMSDNSSVLPRWLRGDDGVLKLESARTDLKMLESAKRELAIFDREAARYKQNQAAYDTAFALHRTAAQDLSNRLGCNQDAANVRSAVTQFLHDENNVREKANALPEGSQRSQLLRECDINAASANYSLASAAETPQQAVAAMQQAREYMQKAGLDPASEDTYKTFGTTKEEFERRAEAYKKSAEPAKPAAAAPDQKGYLSAQFSGVDSAAPAPAVATSTDMQQRQPVVTAAR